MQNITPDARANPRARDAAVSGVVGRRCGPRVVLYSHDTMGLGHTRRNLLIARSLSAPPICANVLMITGIRESGAFGAPPGVDFLTLPSYRKDPDGSYLSRTLVLDVAALADLRAQAIKAAVSSFAPDLLIVDNVPGGALNELLPTLEMLELQGTCRRVLGLRDILDDPAALRGKWDKNFEIVRSYFQGVWIYGDPKLYDTTSEYEFPLDVRLKTSFTGYLNPIPPGFTARACGRATDGEDLILCMVGGGQDGANIASAFAATPFAPGTRGVIITGPFMPEPAREFLRTRAAGDPRLAVREFETDPLSLIRQARGVVAMGGYNTVMELLALEKHALVVPRTKPRMEQFIRAEKLKSMGLLECVPEEELTAEAVDTWITSEPTTARATESLDFYGLDRVVGLTNEMLGCGCVTTERAPLFPPQESLRAAV